MLRLARLFPLAALVSLAIVGCASSSRSVYEGESFATESPYVTWSTREPVAACELGRRALLSQGYQIDNADPQTIRGEKLFQPKYEHSVRLDITLVCLPSNVGAAIYANARQTHFELKSAASNTGLSVTGLGSISLPWAADKESLVKVGEETVVDPDFYRRLFALIDTLEGK